MNQDIVFDNVSFEFDRVEKNAEGEAVVVSVKKHDEQAEVLKNVSFTIPAGKTVGILGGTGSGKSTLVHLLDRLFDLTEGEGKITIGGKDIRGINRKWLRENIGIVLQEPYLFSGTLAENIAITQKEQKMDRVKAAAKIASLDEAVEKFGKGYETYVGERGVTLSGGQKTRVALGKLLLQSPDLIILDEPTNHLDMNSIKWLEGYLMNYKGAVLIVSHDRYFLDRVVTRIFAFEPDGSLYQSEGGYSDYVVHRNGLEDADAAIDSGNRKKAGNPSGNSSAGSDNGVDQDVKSNGKYRAPREKTKLSYKEQREYDTIEEEIEKLEQKSEELEDDEDKTVRTQKGTDLQLQSRIA
jgi:ATPase subunit of ABC transporter with duplicated ATPase domains